MQIELTEDEVTLALRQAAATKAGLPLESVQTLVCWGQSFDVGAGLAQLKVERVEAMPVVEGA